MEAWLSMKLNVEGREVTVCFHVTPKGVELHGLSRFFTPDAVSQLAEVARITGEYAQQHMQVAEANGGKREVVQVVEWGKPG